MKSRESGQLMVIVALGMVVFLGFSALAIDLGRGYSERRNAQNAADAAALAGMRLVVAQPAPSGASIYTTIQDVARANGGAQLLSNAEGGAVFLDQSRSPVPSVSCPACGNVSTSNPPYTGVAYLQVKTKIQYKTLFAGMLGISQMTSGGMATAMLEETGAIPLLPLGFHVNGTCSTPNYGFDHSSPDPTIYDSVHGWWSFFSSNAVNAPGGFGYLTFTGSGESPSTTASYINNGFDGSFLTWKNYKWDEDLAPDSAGSPKYSAWGWDDADGKDGWYEPTPPQYDTTECDGYYADGAGGSVRWDDAGSSPGHPSWGHPEPPMPGSGEYDLAQASPLGPQYTELTDATHPPYFPTISWLSGNSGLGNSSAIQDAIESKKGRDVIILIYNRFGGTGSNSKFQIIGWAGFHVWDVNMHSNPKYIKGTFNTVVIPGPPTGNACTPSLTNPCTVRLVPN